MKINKVVHANSSLRKVGRKEEPNTPCSQFENFSRSYCAAIKAKNLSFLGNMSEIELQQRCDELKKQLLSDGIIEKEDEISWYTDYYANEGNIAIAKKVFSCEHLKSFRRDILKATNEENVPVAAYICDNPFPLNYAFDVLISTNSFNAKASLAMCQSEDIPKDIIQKLLSYVNVHNNDTVAKVVLDEDFPREGKVRSITSLGDHNSDFVGELLDDKEFPKENILYLISKMVNRSETQARQNFYRYLIANSDNPKADIEVALGKINLFNESFLRDFYEHLGKDGRLTLKQINYAFGSAIYKYDVDKKIKTYDALVAQEEFTPDELAKILKSVSIQSKIQDGLGFFSSYPDFPQEFKAFCLSCAFSLQQISSDLNREAFYNASKEFAEVYKKMLVIPELYINGEAETKEEAQEEIRAYVDENFYKLINITKVLGKNTIELLLRKRLDSADSVIESFANLKDASQELLEELLKCKNLEGLEFSPKEKLTLLSIMAGYEACNADMEEIKPAERISIEELKQNLLRHVFKFCGMKEDEIASIPKEIILKWDIDYVHLLALQERTMSYDGDNSLDCIIRAVNLGKDFKSYIQGENHFGTINFSTKEIFEQYGLNYQNWINPSKDCEIKFKYTDSNEERLAQIVSQIEEDIEALRKTPAKNFIDKRFGDCIKDDEFKINERYTKNKQTLETFVKHMFELLDKNIFIRARVSLDNPNKKKNAQITLTIKNHLEQRLKDISQCETKKKEKPVDLTIKMWDRNPTHDLFQGNYSTCCIGLGESNGVAMPTYLLSSMFNMIELVDNNSGNTIGNALCYFATDEYGEPKFIIDNIEIANKHKMSNSTSEKLLSKIVDYCIGLLKTISDRNIPIFMGTSYNDVYDAGQPIIKLDYLKILGEMDYNITYLDAFGGWDEGEFDFNYSDNESYDDSEETKKLELLYLGDSRQDEDVVDDDIV